MADLILRDTDPDEFRRQIVLEIADEIRKIHAEHTSPALKDRVKMAELAGISTSTLDELVAKAVIPSMQIGRRRLFDPAAVIAALSKGGR